MRGSSELNDVRGCTTNAAPVRGWRLGMQLLCNVLWSTVARGSDFTMKGR